MSAFAQAAASPGRLLLLLLLTVAATVAMPAPTAAAGPRADFPPNLLGASKEVVVHVDASAGSDSGDGSASKPLLHLRAALDVAAARQAKGASSAIVLLREGDYSLCNYTWASGNVTLEPWPQNGTRALPRRRLASRMAM